MSVLLAPPERIVAIACYNARRSPCRSKRGVVIFTGSQIIAGGWNAPPGPLACDGSDACRSTCSRSAVHAEQRALLRAGLAAWEADMLHAKVVDGTIVPSGDPSCLECSKLALAAGMAGFWLYHADGWMRYDMLDFHERTLRATIGGSHA